MDKNNILIGVIIVILIVVIMGFVAFSSFSDNTNSTVIEVLSNSTISNGENFTIALLDANNQPIAGKQVDVTLVAVNGDKNTLNLITGDDGKAGFELKGVNEGDYTVNCVFAGDSQNPSVELSTQIVVNNTAA